MAYQHACKGQVLYVAHTDGELIRYDEKGKQVTIECPKGDVVTVCRKYSGLLYKISLIITKNADSFTVTKA